MGVEREREVGKVHTEKSKCREGHVTNTAGIIDGQALADVDAQTRVSPLPPISMDEFSFKISFLDCDQKKTYFYFSPLIF